MGPGAGQGRTFNFSQVRLIRSGIPQQFSASRRFPVLAREFPCSRLEYSLVVGNISLLIWAGNFREKSLKSGSFSLREIGLQR